MWRFLDALRVLTWRQLTAEDMKKCDQGEEVPYNRRGIKRKFYMDGEEPVVADSYFMELPSGVKSEDGVLETFRITRTYTPDGKLRRRTREKLTGGPLFDDTPYKTMRPNKWEVVYEPAGRFWGERAGCGYL